MAAILNYVGLGGGSKPEPPVEKGAAPLRALPSDWYTSPEMFELERRAIFSRRWLILTHSSRVQNAGDFLRYQIAGFDIVLSRDRSGNVTAFHNVCRHRAYPVIEQDQGTVKIFSCRYHGWSYGLNGKLAKAPGYQDIPDFDKSQNGLFSIHTRTDENGFVWINLEAQEEPEVQWEKATAETEAKDRFTSFDFSNYEFDYVSKFDVEYNWKIAADSYSDPKNKYAGPQDSEIASTFYWPWASMTATPHFFFLQKIMPTSATTTTIYYEVYRNLHSPEEEFQKANQIFKTITNEDKTVDSDALENLKAGASVNSDVPPNQEKGPLYFQKKRHEEVAKWHEREQVAKKEIWPARQKLPTKGDDDDVDFCNNLSCSDDNSDLAW